jgi:hypothetical protein
MNVDTNDGDIEFVDRYSATGTPYPHLLTACFECEGMGCYPVKDPRIEYGPGELIPVEGKYTRWELHQIDLQIAENGPEEDGWYFIKCPVCLGTCKVSRWRSLLRFPGWVVKGLRFVWNTRRGGYYGDSLPLRGRLRIAFRS